MAASTCGGGLTVAQCAPSTCGTYDISTIWYTASHAGLNSGYTESEVVVLAKTDGDNHWACGGSAAPGGDGYTGRGGISNYRLWVK